MSVWSTERVTCEGCGAAIEAPVVVSVSASRATAVREQARLAGGGGLHRVRCPGCGVERTLWRTLVYTDLPRRQWVHVALASERPRWPEHEREATALAGRALRAGAPMIAAIADEVRVRVVFGYDELRERLRVWDAGLDDAIVECVKLRCLRERPALRGAGEWVRVAGVLGDGALRLQAGRDGDDGAAAARAWTVPVEVVRAVEAGRKAWRAAFPALFGDGYVSIERYLAGAPDEEAT